MRLPGWTREPLVHFLAAGAAIFLLLAWRGEEVDPASRTIAVTQEDRAQLALQWERTMSRPPTDAELDALTERFVREEVLYREALRLGLDRDDAVLRKRLANKMDYLAGSMAETAAVSDATLQQWLVDHPERFAADTRYTFEQLYFAEKSAAEQALVREPGEGQSISLPRKIAGERRAQVEDRFGAVFTEALDRLGPGERWQGPIASGFGWHLVRLEARKAGMVPPLAEIRDRVETDWRVATKEQREDEAYRVLRDAYEVTVAR